ncbi:putative leucine-rich repeat receptor-like protein kinase At2g19210 isoform X1 [Prosopis cineraria]|uniref:putative leucine-rich repeat receptor-like protein kinase At2g19210 isoform X1 n=1 Tax=Prosopis cineraria TaxID=364024 RepID=UPI00240F4DFE|nr:putative leucine-rich repeat receptor-like protein kinase At2g19210 isoform X1 [Prosopis cineraria]XP_054781154.1 putative leucine-rich repeat receptor-like protein kinase At2g19210 isoform X1 [Prosopis cineraria]XP_054781155.1 putative leucine-rich repeat receptor-like protein kinase At2g19210 isoform X1 [Prosopis cineraria]XP_054781156.1 putative leucine-rich repeat receptor-like protein kinase At2g19210 isoform X1 [Prosopis cineraria]
MTGKLRCNWAWCSLLWLVSVSIFAIQEVDGKSIVQAAEKNSVHHKHARRKLDDVGGSIDIDCGLLDELGYIDGKTKIPYTTDSKVIDTGENRNLSVEFISESLQRIFENVSSFPEGKRNCYTLRHPEGRNTVYLLRASFMYGNYDGLNHPPKFDLYIGVNLWDTVKFDNASHIVIKEILHVPPMDVVHVCLLNAYEETPFISALQMRHLHNFIYANKSQTLALYKRLDFGSTTNEIVRFEEDTYDRIWYPYNLPHCQSLSTRVTIDSLNNAYRLPSTVMRTAVTPTNGSDPLDVQFDTRDPISKFYVYMHFAEIKELQKNERRKFNITLNGKLLDESIDYVILNYLDPTTIYNPQPITGPKLWFSLNKKENSSLPPILNAMEIYFEKDSYQEPTAQEDVNAIIDIKQAYTIKSWQGDPCAPMYYSWDGVNCSYKGYHAPRIIELNLSSSNLSGTISQSFSMLKSLEYLDLSNNSLSGSLPDFFIHLPHLKTLNLSGNMLSGEIPSPLMERSNSGSLLLSVDRNPDLCLKAPCNKEDKSTFPLHAVIAILSSVVFLIVLGVVVSIIWRRKFSKKPANQPVISHEEVVLKSNNTQFTYSQIVDITNNFEKMIGKGGSGTVYHGSLSDDTQVAVKMLSSPESSKQFQTEAELLMRVHHRNLASFLGYCNEGGHTAIIYEFMAYGNLEKCLSGSKKELSSWKNRIQIAVDAAQGLEYLHHGCKPPIVHRDIKTSNILLNEKMQAKVADFGFSKFFSAESESHMSTGVIGTFGYLDPEYYSSYRITERSDVYSFGVVLLELITGQRAIIKGQENTHIVNWVTPFVKRGDLQQIVDPSLQGDFDFGSMWKAVEAALACVSLTAIQRPSMNYVVPELKESLEMEAAREQKWGTNEQRLKSTSSFDMHVVDLETASGPEAR